MKKFTRIEPTTIQEVGGVFKRHIVIKRFQSDDGLEHEFTTFNREGSTSVAVLAITNQNQVVISRQFRAGREYYCDDLPGGGVESDESIEVAARRELFEETGYSPGDMEYLGKYSWMSNANLVSHYFLATNCEKTGNPERDEREIEQGQEVDLISIRELFDAARADKVNDAVAVLLAYEKLKELEGTK